MLVRVNPTLGGATDERARAINMLRCIQAVCTAAAGSTPSVVPVTAPSTNGTGDCIVEVIANTEAGGWTSSASTTVTTAYNASNSTYYLLDLYNTATGKSAYPYFKTSFATNVVYPFNSSYTSYPYIDMIVGFHTATTADGNYLSGFTSHGFAANQYSDYTSKNMGPWGPSATSTVNAASGYRAFRPSNGEYLIASTSNYIIILNPNFLGYAGLRSNAGWENNYNNNPYVIGFAYNCYSSYSASINTPSSVSTTNGIAAWGYGFDNSGAVSTSPKWHVGTSNQYDIIGGIGAGQYWSYNQWGYDQWNGYVGPLMPFGLRSNNGNTMIGPATDSATGANVPPAYPIVANFGCATTHWQFNAIRSSTGMVLPGMYRSLSGSDAYMSQFYTAGTTYVVGTENYYPYTIGTYTGFKDLMLVRKY